MSGDGADNINVAMVVATARNGVIGRDGDLPWRVPSDLKWFKRVTMGKPVVMGRKTFASIGKPLPGRTNIVLTRRDDFSAEGVLVAASTDEALGLAREAARAAGVEELAIIGGGEVYAAFLPETDRIYLTQIDLDAEGDARFPDLASDAWRRREAENPPPADPRDDAPARYFVLERAKRRAESGENLGKIA